ncbi:unnamed protein product, partial [Urochloa humidicola]
SSIDPDATAALVTPVAPPRRCPPSLPRLLAIEEEKGPELKRTPRHHILLTTAPRHRNLLFKPWMLLHRARSGFLRRPSTSSPPHLPLPGSTAASWSSSRGGARVQPIPPSATSSRGSTLSRSMVLPSAPPSGRWVCAAWRCCIFCTTTNLVPSRSLRRLCSLATAPSTPPSNSRMTFIFRATCSSTSSSLGVVLPRRG